MTTGPPNQLTLERCKSVALKCKRSLLPGSWPHGLKDKGQEGVGKSVKAAYPNPVGYHMTTYTLNPLCWTVIMGGVGEGKDKGTSGPCLQGTLEIRFPGLAALHKV